MILTGSTESEWLQQYALRSRPTTPEDTVRSKSYGIHREHGVRTR